jgi:3-phosphoglycerate kinase
MISLIPTDAPAIVQNLLVFVSSLIWGGAIAGVFYLCRGRKINSSAMQSKHNA